MTAIVATVQSQSGDFLQAIIFVYSLCILSWLVASIVFSLGVGMPYARWSNAVLDFLRDVSEPYLRLFRRLGWLSVGPLDLSPIVALLVLNIGGNLLVRIVQSA